MNLSRLTLNALLAFAAAAAFTACGGGGGGKTTPQPTATPTPTPTPTPTAAPAGSVEGCNGTTSTTSDAAGGAAAQGMLVYGGGSEPRRGPGRAGSDYVGGQIAVIYRTADHARLRTASGAMRFAGTEFPEVSRIDFNYIGKSSTLVKVASGTEDQVVAQLRRDPNVLSVSRVARRYAIGAFATPTPYPVTNPYFPVNVTASPYVGQWDMQFTMANYAWGFTTQPGSINTLGNGITIAIIDTGVDINNPNLNNGGVNKIAGTKCFVTGAVNPTGSDVSDLVGHGTNVAGIAADVGTTQSNALGFTGMGYGSKIFAYKVFPNPPAGGSATCDAHPNNPACFASGFDVAQALNDIVNNRTAQVVNLSLGSPGSDASEEPAVANAIAAGVVVVAAAGNSAANTPVYPGIDPGVIAVGASALNDTAPYTTAAPGLYVASYSNWGTGNTLNDPASWGIVAPGGDPLNSELSGTPDYLHWINNIASSAELPVEQCKPSTLQPPLNTNTTPFCRALYAGTSQATPHVAGAVALLLGAPNAPSGTTAPATVKATLCTTADPVLGMVLPGNQSSVPANRPTASGSTPHVSSTGAAGCGELNIYRAMSVQVFGAAADPMVAGSIYNTTTI